MRRRLVDAGVSKWECATPLQLTTALDTRFDEVLLACAVRGPALQGVIGLAWKGKRRISVLVEYPKDVNEWAGTPMGVFIDLDPDFTAAKIRGMTSRRLDRSPPLSWQPCSNSVACTHMKAARSQPTRPGAETLVHRWLPRCAAAPTNSAQLEHRVSEIVTFWVEKLAAGSRACQARWRRRGAHSLTTKTASGKCCERGCGIARFTRLLASGVVHVRASPRAQGRRFAGRRR